MRALNGSYAEYTSALAASLDFEAICDAHRVMEANDAPGKMVVVLDLVLGPV